jgi:hypothetical protein
MAEAVPKETMAWLPRKWGVSREDFETDLWARPEGGTIDRDKYNPKRDSGQSAIVRFDPGKVIHKVGDADSSTFDEAEGVFVVGVLDGQPLDGGGRPWGPAQSGYLVSIRPDGVVTYNGPTRGADPKPKKKTGVKGKGVNQLERKLKVAEKKLVKQD